MIYKCKICGGTLNLSEKKTVVTCEYCGTVQSVPLLDSEKKERLFAKALDYRLDCDFDRAYNAYETIINDEPDEPEAYWGALLSDYGIEYVKDSYSGRMLPTCHRTKVKSILNHDYYIKALELADTENRNIYESDAKEIDAIQRKIIALASKEEPCDVFICYKETDKNGKRTRDSLIAENIYNLLTEKGYKVFFSRISLEDKIGREYEPYIFNALNTAKVMLAVGCDYENYESTWVKNEWTRFLDLKKDNHSKILIPCHFGLNPNNLPEELSVLQSLDLSSIGYEQDLLRGLDKIFNRAENINVQIKQESKGNKKTIICALLVVIILTVTFFVFRSAKSAESNMLEVGNDVQTAEEAFVNPYADLKIGDTLCLGTYEDEDVVWEVVAKEEDRVLVISKYVIECLQFDESPIDTIRYQDSSLRWWLNHDFYDNAFTSEDKKYLVYNKIYEFDGTYIQDKIFILSREEIEKYLDDNNVIAEGTQHAFSTVNSTKTDEQYNLCYWVRTLGTEANSIIDLDIYGNYYKKGYPVYYTDGVRPAMWINISESVPEKDESLFKIRMVHNMCIRKDRVLNDNTYVGVTNTDAIYDCYEVVEDSDFTWYKIGNDLWVGDFCCGAEILDENNEGLSLYKLTLSENESVYSDIEFTNSNYVRTLPSGYDTLVYEEKVDANGIKKLRIGLNLWIECPGY